MVRSKLIKNEKDRKDEKEKIDNRGSEMKSNYHQIYASKSDEIQSLRHTSLSDLYKIVSKE